MFTHECHPPYSGGVDLTLTASPANHLMLFAGVLMGHVPIIWRHLCFDQLALTFDRRKKKKEYKKEGEVSFSIHQLGIHTSLTLIFKMLQCEVTC